MDDGQKTAMNHAWNWFQLHAAQRLQALNFFLITTAFLTSAYSVALNADKPPVAAVIGVIGAIAAALFWRLELRTKALVKAGERALKVSEALLAAEIGSTEIQILEHVDDPLNKDNPKGILASYGAIIPAIEGAIFLSFLAGAAYGVYLSLT